LHRFSLASAADRDTCLRRKGRAAPALTRLPEPPTRMDLVEITPQSHAVILSLAYATPQNITGKPIYRQAKCYLHRDAEPKLARAIELAKGIDLTLKIFDAFRPSEAQWILWNHAPNPEFFADPRKGSPHSRGVAIDLTLVDAAGNELEMGTPFDDMTPNAHHGALTVSPAAQRNRAILLGLMSAAGWDFYKNEWWHYQLFNSRSFPLFAESDLKLGLM
jgi:D-alanyl-D-alanine dipeptidase